MIDHQELRRQLDEQRTIVRQLEDMLRDAERRERDEYWFPQGFYTAYYILSGMVIGMLAAWAVLIFNYVGALAFGMEDPLKLLRVYATFIGGESTMESRDAVALVFSFLCSVAEAVALCLPSSWWSLGSEDTLLR